MWHRWCRNQGVDVPNEESDAGTEVCAGSIESHAHGVTEAAPGAPEEI